MRKTIVLADDHQLLREGVRTILKDLDTIHITAEVTNGTDLLTHLKSHRPDLVLLDLNMPGQDGLNCLSVIKELYPSVKVLVLTNYNQSELIDQVKKMNADGFLVKNSSSAELKEAVVDVLNGHKRFHQSKPVEKSSEPSHFVDDFSRKYQLTKREIEIIRLICKELSSKEIATELFLSEFTVNTHRKNIFKKLNVKNVAGVVNFAKANNLL
jgi:DNA-binding NarL/FixJ family response regulator